MNNTLIELIKAIATLLWPVCILIIAFIFRKDISELLSRMFSDKRSIRDDEKNDKTSFELSSKPDISIPNKSDEEDRACLSEDEPFLAVCKNIQTGDYFIVIEEINNDEAKLITPKGEIKQLELKLFDELEEKNIKNLLGDNLISHKQLLKFNKYIEKDANNYIEHYLQPSATIPLHHAVYDEPHYIRSFRNMLNNPNTIPSRMLRRILMEQSIKWIDLREFPRNNLLIFSNAVTLKR